MAQRSVKKVMTQPINLIFRFLQSRTRIQIWLYENTTIRIEGRIIGFDEYMNVVLDDAEEVNMKTKARTQLDRILLKGLSSGVDCFRRRKRHARRRRYHHAHADGAHRGGARRGILTRDPLSAVRTAG